MPVRIYDISKKLGLVNKQVLAKAKELGLTAARVASSSLDKITAEYLEQEIIKEHPELVAPPPPPPTPSPPADQTLLAPAAPPPAEFTLVREPETTSTTAPASAEAAAPTAQAPAPL